MAEKQDHGGQSRLRGLATAHPLPGKRHENEKRGNGGGNTKGKTVQVSQLTKVELNKPEMKDHSPGNGDDVMKGPADCNLTPHGRGLGNAGVDDGTVPDHVPDPAANNRP